MTLNLFLLYYFIIYANIHEARRLQSALFWSQGDDQNHFKLKQNAKILSARNKATNAKNIFRAVA